MTRNTQRFVALATALLVPAIALAEDGGHGGGHGGWDATALIASFVNFFILISLFIWMGRDKVAAFLKERKAAVEVELNEAARLRAEAEAKHKEYSDRLAKLDQELEQIKREMIAAGTKERDRIIADAEEKASRMRKEAQFIIEQQAKQLREDITREAGEAAVAAAEQLITKATTSFDHQRLAQEYLTALQKQYGAGPKSAAPQAAQTENVA